VRLLARFASFRTCRVVELVEKGGAVRSRVYVPLPGHLICDVVEAMFQVLRQRYQVRYGAGPVPVLVLGSVSGALTVLAWPALALPS
jgi:hypothetical protein